MDTGQNAAADGDGFLAYSSVADDVWHDDKATGAYEWWYFDAASDDGRDVLVVIFLSNFIFSPRYNRAAATGSSADADEPAAQFPAISFWWYRDGKVRLRAINEFPPDQFTASADVPACRIGQSSFHLQRLNGEVHYRLRLDETLRRNRKLEASLEWLVTNGDLAPRRCEPPPTTSTQAHEWNLVAPRCRVSGTLSVSDSRGRKQTHEFRGTGYHDHNRDRRPVARTVSEWQWGRAHFADRTAVFYRYLAREVDRPDVSRLFIADDDRLRVHDVRFVEDAARRDIFGLRHPRSLRIEFQDEHDAPAALLIEQRRVLERSFFYLRFAGEARLETNGRGAERATVLSEHLAPRALGWRWLHWLIDMRIGRNGRNAFLP